MKSLIGVALAATALAAVLLAIVTNYAVPPVHAQNSARHARYVVIDLGTLGGTSSGGSGINNEGWVTGAANLLGDQSVHAFLWRHGHMSDLGTLGGPNSGVFWPVKDERGLIVGWSDSFNTDPLGEDFCGFGTNLICLGFLWQNGVMSPLPTLGGNNAQAYGVNNRGQVVGLAENSTSDPNCIAPQLLDFEAVIWGPKQGEVHELAPFPGDAVGAAIAINDKGQAVGASGICGPVSDADSVHAVLWQNGSVIDLGSFGGSFVNYATAINNRGEVVGDSDLPGDITEHAFLWRNGVMKDLGTLPGDFSSGATGINDKGQVVGNSCDQEGNCRAFLWESGVMKDLNSLVCPGSSLSLISGGDINLRGEIVGTGYDQNTGDTPAFLAIPSEGRGDCQADSPAGEKVTLPEHVRERLRHRRGFGRFAAGPIGPH